jgi:hypothetical protein
VALEAPDAANPRAGQTSFVGDYYVHPEKLASDRLLEGGGLVAVGFLILAVVGYFRFFYAVPSAESLRQVANTGAAGDYGPRSADVAEYLRTLAAMPDADWQRVGDLCMSSRMSSGDAVARLALSNVNQAIQASGRRQFANRAYAMAEKVVRAHPRVADQAGVDVRNYMVAPLATIAAAMVVVDVASPDDFRAVYQPMAWAVPYDPVRPAAPQVAPQVPVSVPLAQTA